MRRVIGRLGLCTLAPGFYVYTGSARRGLEARIARHLRKYKPVRWHIDYVLEARQVRIVGVRRTRLAECRLNALTRGRTPVEGFGASDCRSGCRAHLKWVGRLGPHVASALGPGAAPDVRWESQ